MHAVERALVWEFWRRSRWRLPLCILVCSAWSVFILYSLGIRMDGADRLLLARYMYAVLFWMQAVLVCTSVAAATTEARAGGWGVGVPARLLALPVSAARAAIPRILLSAGAAAVGSALVMAFYNALSGNRFSLLDAALFTGAAMAAGLAISWTFSDFIFPRIAAFGALIFLLAKWHGAPAGADLEEVGSGAILLRPGAVDWAGALALIAGSCALGAWSVGRMRRGETLRWPDAWQGTRRAAWATTHPLSSARSPRSAQLWLDWRRKGLLLPCLFAFMLLAALVVALATPVGWGEWGAALAGCASAAGGVLTYGAFAVGAIIGSTSASSKGLAMSQFRATRPISDTALSESLLRVGFLSVLLTWLLALAATALVGGLQLWLGGSGPQDGIVKRLHSFHLLGLTAFEAAIYLLPLAWTLAGLGILLTLAGRNLVSGVVVLLFVTLILSAPFLSRHWDALRGLTLPFALLVISATALALAFAARQGRLRPRSVFLLAAFILLLASSGLVNFGFAFTLSPTRVAGALALACLPVLPIALAPFAVSWNRHR